MKPITQYGQMTEKHWREFLPKMVAELEAKGQLHAMLLDAQQQTEAEMERIRHQLMRQGLTAQQAHDSAWEIVRERYIFLPPET
jgi:formate dehydrogenase maturation protein FdhE